MGNARSLLAELGETEKISYSTLVTKLIERYGSLNQTEVFEAKLRNRRQEPNDPISELAQNIKKISQLAYQNVPSEVMASIAIYHFTDALSDPDLRLRLREANL